MTANQQIAAIDKEITSIHRQMKKLEKIDPMSSESWQAAWDKHPDLQQQETALFRKRGQFQVVRDEQRSKIVAKQLFAERIRETKAAKKHTGIFQYLFDCSESAKTLGFPELSAWYSSGLQTLREARNA